jgi:hypothetical protein
MGVFVEGRSDDALFPYYSVRTDAWQAFFRWEMEGY